MYRLCIEFAIIKCLETVFSFSSNTVINSSIPSVYYFGAVAVERSMHVRFKTTVSSSIEIHVAVRQNNCDFIQMCAKE